MGDFRKLEVWQRARRLAASVYRQTALLPTTERYGLTSQMRRATVSVAANVAEGCGRKGDIELRRFLRISLGSLAELECELVLAEDLKLLQSTGVRPLVAEIGEIRAMLQSLHDALPGRRT
jgi:four helix bundle protein